MKYLKPLILERKSFGNLYHVLDYEKMLFLLKTNTLKSYKAGDGKISLTRDKMFNSYLGDSPTSIFKLVIDGNRLSDRFKIRPFAYKKMRAGYLKEFEEQVQTSLIKNAFSYIDKVVLIKEKVERLRYTAWGDGTLSDYLTTVGAFNGSMPQMISKIVEELKSRNKVLYVQDGTAIKRDNEYIDSLINFPLKEIETKFIIAYRGGIKTKKDSFGSKDVIVDLDGNILQDHFVIGHTIDLKGKNTISFKDRKEAVKYKSKYPYKEFPQHNQYQERSNEFKPYVLEVRLLDNGKWKIDEARPLDWF